MPQSEAIGVKVLVDVSELQEARVLVKRVKNAAREAETQLAKLEERLVGLDGELADHGIRLEIGGNE